MIESCLISSCVGASPVEIWVSWRSRRTLRESFELFGDVEKKNGFFSDKWHSRKLKEILGTLRIYMFNAFFKAVRLC